MEFDELSLWSYPLFETTPQDDSFKEGLKLDMLRCIKPPVDMEFVGAMCELIDNTDCSDCDSVEDFLDKIIERLKRESEGGQSGKVHKNNG